MADWANWTSLIHSMAGALVGAGAALSGQLIVAANSRRAAKESAHFDHKKWSRDLAAEAHDGYIVEFERLTPFYGNRPDPLPTDWLNGLHLKLQRMRLVCSEESVALAHAAMHRLERYNTVPSEPWQPVQASFDIYLDAARRDLGLRQHPHAPSLPAKIVEHATGQPAKIELPPTA